MADHSGHQMPKLGTGSGKHDKALKISAWLTGVYFIIELGIGIYTGSIAVISDAFHTFSAVGGVVLAIIAARIARRSASVDYTFGWYRAEIIGALLNGVFLAGMAVIVLVMGYMRLRNPIDLPTTPMLIAAAGGLFTEFISMKLLFSRQKGDLNMRGAFWHVVQTFVGSILIIVTAIVIRFTGFLEIDPLLGMAFGIVLLYASWGIMREALQILMESAPSEADLKTVIARLESLPEILDVHHVHAWTLTSNKTVFSAHIKIDKSADSVDLLKETQDILRSEFKFAFATLQFERSDLDESHASDLDFLYLEAMKNNE
ncbi:MAG: cation diffusion facilitator family transporter [Fimbriimonadaceae bacterium]|nr:cation diffusion facilitator family transporter [Alphaproteobacteria bacterium]